MRYFIEVKYKGTNYAGFQIQKNASTIQSEVERVLRIFFRMDIKLTGSSRTDAGVHANQNYFQFDFDRPMPPNVLYNLNALLPFDIAILSVRPVIGQAHARFDAVSRQYIYHINAYKNPFVFETAWFYPYTVDIDALQKAADMLLNVTDFTAFSKRNSQVHTHNCSLVQSNWSNQNSLLIYTVKANRFLRGMVRGLVGTMLLVGRGALSLDEFSQVIQDKDCTKANFATPAHGLFLNAVDYPAHIFSVV